MSKGKKRAVTLIALCALLVAGVLLYLLVPEGESEDGQDGDSKATIKVAEIDKDKIVSVHVSGGDREEISLTKEGDAWRLADWPDAPLVSETVEGMFSSLSPVMATKELEAAELAEYGLSDPQMIVKIGTSDGQEYELKLGGEVPTTGGNYGLFGDGNKIYTFEEALFSAFDIEKTSLVEKEEIADINEDYLTSISVQQDGKAAFAAEIVPDEKKVDAYTNWVITEPYKKPLAGSSTDDWSTLQSYFTSIKFEKLVDYVCEDLGKYGLDKPSATAEVHYFELKDGYTIPEETASPDGGAQKSNNSNKANIVPDEYKDAKSYKLLFGDQAEDGGYYVCLDGSKQVYTLAEADAENMLGADAYTYMDRCVYSTLATDITGYDVTIGDKKISVTRSSEKDEDGKDQNTWTLNGKQVPEGQVETFLKPYSKTFLLEFTSTAKDSVKPKDSEPVMTVVYHEPSRDVTVKYLPYDGTNFYRVDKDGMDYFLVDKRSADDAIAAFASLLDLDLSE